MKKNRFWAATGRVLAVVTIALFVISVLAPAASAANKYKVLYHFTGGADGSRPNARMMFDSVGNLYGTTVGGGAYGNGTVFELTPNSDGTWTETVLYSFTGGADGGTIWAPLTVDAAGNFYSVTDLGGAYGDGTVFMLTSNSEGNWTESVLYSFMANSDGAHAGGGLIFDSSGNLYGTTNNGGGGKCNFLGRGCGTVFELSPNSDGTWTESVLYKFIGGKAGSFPGDSCLLVFDASGNLYGATFNPEPCQNNDCGVVYQLTPKSNGRWAEKTLLHFTGRNGAGPSGSVTFDAAGNVYGVATRGSRHGAGNVFTLTPESDGKWRARIIHDFTGGKDGKFPYDSVTFDASGNLYGETQEGGRYGHGTVYRLTPSSGGRWAETVLHHFKGGREGDSPRATPTFDAAGNIYGTTTDENIGGSGVVYEITP